MLKAYRDWKISGDTAWLRAKWPAIEKSFAYAWAPTNEDSWDSDQDGVLSGHQHHTLDMELFGPNTWLNGFCLAALKATAEMAEFLGHTDLAQRYRELFARGKAFTDQHLFNGAYYQQRTDLSDRRVLDAYPDTAHYWDEETGQIKHQIGDGCEINQVAKS